MNRRQKALLGGVAGVVLVIAALLLYLTFSDLSGWRDTVSRVASNALGRKLTIAGEFKADIGRITGITATDLTLANAEWGSDPVMAKIDSLALEIDLWSLVSGPLRLPTVEVDGGSILFESDRDGRSNWALGDPDPAGASEPFALRIDHIAVGGFLLQSRHPTEDVGLDLMVSSLHSEGDASGMHRLTLDGTMSNAELGLSGRFGPLTGLVNTSSIDLDLVGSVGSTELRCRGTIDDLAALAGLDIEAGATIPSPDELTALFDLPSTGAGPLTVEVEAKAANGLTALTATISADAMYARVSGTIDSLTAPSDVDVEIEASGPDIRPIAAFGGIGDLPAQPFSAAGRVRWRGFPVEVEGLELRVGDNTVSADGRFGKPPLMLETDFRMRGSGPDISALSALGGVSLPPDRFAIDGRLVRAEKGLRLDDVKASIGRAALTANGFVGDPPEYEGTDLAFTARGPDLARFSSRGGVDLPAGAFDISGSLADGGDAIALRGVQAQIGRNTLSLDGRVTTASGMIGTDLALVADGPDLSALGPATGIEGLPKASFHVAGGVAVERGGYRLTKLEGRLADLELAADGLVSRTAGLVGSALRVEAHGADLSNLAPVVGAVLLPAEPFRVAGNIELLPEGIDLRGLELELGSARGTIDGRIGPTPGFQGTEIQAEARGPSLAIAGPLLPGLDLPDVGFDIQAVLALNDGAIQITDGVMKIDGNTITATGVVEPHGDLSGSAVDLSVQGPDLSSVGRLASAALKTEWPALPGLPYSITGSLAADEGGYQFDSLDVALGRAHAEIVGRVGRRPELDGTDLALKIDGPDASLFQALTDTEIPVAPYEVHGRVAIADRSYAFSDVHLRLGEYRASIDGAIGSPPKLIGTDVRLDVEGPDLTLVGDLIGRPGLPALPFRLAGDFEGDQRRFKADGVAVSLGSSDISGSCRVDLEAKPAATCTLRSRRIDLAQLRPARSNDDAETTGTRSAPPPVKADRLIPDTPIDLAILETFDLDLGWDIGELVLQLSQYRDIGISTVLDAGRLEVERFEAVDSGGGSLHGTAALEPAAEGYRVRSEFTMDEARINLAGKTADPSQYAPVDLHVDLSAVGRTPHEIAASSNGRVSVVVAGGVVAASVVDLVAADILMMLLEALNPFSQDNHETELNCAVLVANFDNGVMTLDPAAIQTEKVTILGSGTINFATEKLKLDWVTKPRKGIGLSASAITNPYIRLGGTLADPALQMKPIEALATTGVAVATAGLSILGKGLLDRITAEKKVCEQAMAQAERQINPQQPKTNRKRR